MKKLLPIIGLLVCALNVNAQSWDWAKSASCSGGSLIASYGSEGWLVKSDNQHNIYVAGGNYGDSICLDGFKFYNSIYEDNIDQTFISKYDSSGNVLWSIGSNDGGNATPISMTIDNAGNLCVYGYYASDSIWFGSHLMVNPNYGRRKECYYILKISSDGDIIWAKNGANIANRLNGDRIGDIKTDVAGSVYVCGYFSDSTIQIGRSTLIKTTLGFSDIFVAKYDSSGNAIWAKRFGGDDADFSDGLAISEDNSIYMIGDYGSDSIFFDTTVFTYSGMLPTSGGTFTNVFLTKMDSSGNVIWARNLIGDSKVNDVVVDKNGDIYIGGGLKDTMVSFGSFTYRNPLVLGSGFLIKYNSSGDIITPKILYPSAPTSLNGNEIIDLAIDGCNNVWITGKLYGSGGMLLDSVGTTLTAPVGSASDPVFFTQYTANGRLLDYFAFTEGADDTYGFCTDDIGNIYWCDDYGSVHFGIGRDTLLKYTGEDENFFVAKYRSHITCDLSTQSISNSQQNIAIYPNPAQNELTISSSNNITHIVITNLLGQTLDTKECSNPQVKVDVSNLLSGIYLIRINDTEVRKFVKE